MGQRITTAEFLTVFLADGTTTYYDFKRREVYQRNGELTKPFLNRLRTWMDENGIDTTAPFMIYDNFYYWKFNGYNYEFGTATEW